MRQTGLIILATMAAILMVSSSPVPEKQHTLHDLEKEISAVDSNQGLVRDKRTIGVLRDLFPNFSQFIDRKIQMLTRIIFRLVGRLVLGGAGGGGGGGNGSDDGRMVSITLPTYPPSEDDDDEDEDEDEGDDSSSSQSSQSTTTAKPPTEGDEENKVDEGSSRKKRQTADDDSLQAAPETSDNDDGDKGFLNFNLAGQQQTAASGGSGGSGNLLFDVIRLVSGSGSGSSSSSSGGGATETDKDDAEADGQLEGAHSENVDQGYDGFGLPGPLTRLFVIANRGVASLIQDLILRLAQASEKVVNYKARLITSII